MTPAIVRHYVGACDIDQASRSDYFCPTRQNPDLLNHSPRRSQRNFSLAGHAELNTSYGCYSVAPVDHTSGTSPNTSDTT